jgi:hypothetical protein
MITDQSYKRNLDSSIVPYVSIRRWFFGTFVPPINDVFPRSPVLVYIFLSHEVFVVYGLSFIACLPVGRFLRFDYLVQKCGHSLMFYYLFSFSRYFKIKKGEHTLSKFNIVFPLTANIYKAKFLHYPCHHRRRASLIGFYQSISKPYHPMSRVSRYLLHVLRVQPYCQFYGSARISP